MCADRYTCPSDKLGHMPGVFRNIGETAGGRYARREFQERGELRMKVTKQLGASHQLHVSHSIS